MIQNTNIGVSKTYVNQNIGVWNWVSTHTYASGDLVTYNGTLYVSLQDGNINQVPTAATTYWAAYNKSGSGNIGTDLKPIKIVNGVPTAVANDLLDVSSNQTITGLKSIANFGVGFNSIHPYGMGNVSGWVKILKITGNTTVYGIVHVLSDGYMMFKAIPTAVSYSYTGNQSYEQIPMFKLATDTQDNSQYLFARVRGNHHLLVDLVKGWIPSYQVSPLTRAQLITSWSVETDPATNPQYTNVIDGVKWQPTPATLTYDSTDTDCLINVGLLQQSTDVVHTSGNESVYGEKYFYGKQYGNLSTLAPSGTSLSAYVKVADLGVSSTTADLFINFAYAERYSCGYVHFNYVTNSAITSSAKTATSDTQNISVGIFEETNGHAWLVTKRLASGANRCLIYGMLTMRGTAELIPILNIDGTTFTDADGTYYEGARI